MFLRKFHHAKDTLHWTTGPILFQKFEILLQGFHRQAWSDEAEAVGTKTVQHFADALTSFKSQLLENEDYDDQMDYIQQLKKAQCATQQGWSHFAVSTNNYELPERGTREELPIGQTKCRRTQQ
jgi:hypothetical protein